MAVNTAWADAIGKVLGSEPKKAKSVILAKAKKDKDVSLKRKSEDQDHLELVKSDGTVVKAKKQRKPEETKDTSYKKNKLSKHEWDVKGKVKPSVEDRERERLLCSIATKGVVQLFNAVKEQQSTIDSKLKEVGSSETRRDKVLSQFDKRQFLDKLKNSSEKNKVNNNEDNRKGKKWKVLSNDFMVGAKMNDWDKDSDSDQD